MKQIKCPICKNTKWEFKGFKSMTRFVDGITKCENNHRYNICQDILRLDREASSEEMQFLDHELTGYPKEVEENDRQSFLEVLEHSLQNLISDDRPLAISGNLILFFRFIPNFSNMFVVVNEDEGILRQVQMLTVQKQIFQNSGFIRVEDWKNDQFLKIHFLDPKSLDHFESGDIVYRFTHLDDNNGDMIWKTDYIKLIKQII